MAEKISEKAGLKLTREVMENRKYVLNLCKPDGVPVDLDLTDDIQFKFLMDERGGEAYLEKYFPRYHQQLHEWRDEAVNAKKLKIKLTPQHRTLLERVAAGEEVSSNWYDIIQIPALIAQRNVNAGAGGGAYSVQSIAAVSFTQGMQSMNATLTIANPNTGQIIAQTGTAQTFDQGYDTIILAKGSTNTLNGIEASLSIDGVPYQTGVPIQKIVKMALMDYIDPSKPIVVTDPVHRAKKPNSGFMKICMGRSADDCDYLFDYQPAGQDPTPNLTVSGSVSYGGKITQPSADTSKFGVYFFVRRRSGGATQLFTGTDAFKYFNLSGDSHTLAWNFPKATFETAPWNQGEEVDMNLTVAISVDSLTKNTSFQVTSLKGVDPNPSVAKVDFLKFVWGCLADESKIRMADGSEKRIDFIQPGEKVRTDVSGKDLTVQDIVTGIEEKPCLRITTQNGRSVLLTSGHPVCTGDGFFLANELSRGDLVRTESGFEMISKIEEERYLGIVYNLRLSEDDEDTLNAPGATHYANGILVGDGNMQGTLLRQRLEERRINRSIAELPEEWRFDAENALRLSTGEEMVPFNS